MSFIDLDPSVCFSAFTGAYADTSPSRNPRRGRKSVSS
jgi:hypothetical protein